jgi:hypothetical protein
VAKINDDEVLVAGGAGPTASCEIINVRTRTIRKAPEMLAPRASFATVTTPAGMIVAVSGWSGGSYRLVNSVEQYDPVSEQWSIVGTLLVPRFQHTASMIDDHRILIVGGRNEQAQTMTHCEIFDLRTGTSTIAADFPYFTSQHKALRLSNGQVVIIGGRAGGPNSFRSDMAYRYDVANDTWVEFARLPEPTFYPATVDDRGTTIIVAGGSVKEYQDGTFDAHDRVSILGAGSVVTLDDRMSVAKIPQAVVAVGDGRKLVIGGWLGSNRATASCDWIDETTARVTPGPSLRSARGEASCIALDQDSSSGVATILSIGGLDSNRRTSNVVEILTVGCNASGQSVLPSERHTSVDAAETTSSFVRLTPAEPFARGAVWAREKVDLTKPFSMLVGFRMRNGNDNGDLEEVPSAPGADGIALVIQNEGPQAIGQYGRGIGYDGIKRSIAVEFDTYHNSPVNDPNGNHIGIQSMGKAQNTSRHAPPANLGFTSNVLPMRADGSVYYAYMEYVNKQIRVYLNDRPSFQAPALVRDIDIDSLIGFDSVGKVWVGITSATGRSVEEHEIIRWEINACPEDSPVSVIDRQPDTRSPIAPFVIVEDRLLRDDADPCVVEIIDIRGRVVWTTSTTAREIDLPTAIVASGQYIVSMRSVTGTSMQRWLVMH